MNQGNDKRNPDFKPSRDILADKRNRRKRRNQKRFQESLQRTSDFILQNEEDKFEIDLLIKASKARQEEASDRLGIIISNLTNTELNDKTKKEIAIIIKLIKDSILDEIEAGEMMEKDANDREGLP